MTRFLPEIKLITHKITSNNISRVFLFGMALLLSSCGHKTTENTSEKGSGILRKHALYPKYALGFTVYENDHEVIFTSRNPHDTNQVYGILKLEKKDSISLKKTFNKLCLTSTTHSFLFDAIGSSSSVAGMSAMRYIQDPALAQKYRAQKVVNIGKDDQLNRETIISVQPDGMMVYPYDGSDYSDYEKAGIQLLYNAEYLEENPLGRVEWIKMAGLLTGKNKEAIVFFNNIEKMYMEARASVKNNVSPVTVILGKPIENTWHVPGNSSFAAEMVKDAGAVYGFEMVEGNNVQGKSMEWVLQNGTAAAYWLFTDYATEDYTLSELSKQNKIYPHLQAVQKKQVIVCNSAKVDFFGKGVIEPHVMLKDMIYHFHGIPQDYTPVYFKKIN